MSDDIRETVARIISSLEKGDPEAAYTLSSTSLELHPRHPALLAFAGVSGAQLQRWVEAKRFLSDAISLGNPAPVVYYHLGITHQAEGGYMEAVGAFEGALKLDTSYFPARLQLGNCLVELGRTEEANRLLEDLLHASSDMRIHKSLGVSSIESNDLDKARYHFEAAVTAFPDWAEAKLNLGFVLLKQNQFDLGWQYHEARFEAETARRGCPVNLPKWKFDSGRKVLVWTEQGIGDVVMYAGQLGEISQVCSQVGVVADSRLHSLFARSWPSIECFDFSISEQDAARYDCQISIESCTNFFRRSLDQFDTARIPYLKANGATRQAYVEQFNRQSGEDTIKVGLSWHSVNTEVGGRRSIPFESLMAPLSAKSELQFVNLQYGDVSSEVRWAQDNGIAFSHPQNADYLQDLEAFAAAVSACDYVVTIDNSTAHFAGALGIPQALMLPFVCDWRWGTADEAIWYSHCQLIRQSNRDSWQAPLQRLEQWLDATCVK